MSLQRSENARMGGTNADYVTGVWYVAAIARELKPGRTPVRLFGRDLVLTRTGEQVTAQGAEDGRPWPAVVSQGLAWIHLAAEGEAGDPPPPPVFDAPGRARFVETARLPAHMDDAVYGLLDPAHGPFVHASPLWRTSKTLKEKEKHYEPSARGFVMQPHTPTNSPIYKIIGGTITISIGFDLPGLRAERISNEKHVVLGLTALTPVDEAETIIRQIFFWDTPVMTLLRPLMPLFAGPFLQQDVAVMRLRSENMRYADDGVLIRDADALFMWYRKLKREWRKAQEEGRAFRNPIRPATLRWRT